MSKKITVLIALFVVQFFGSSCDFCDCGDADIYERTYNAVHIDAFDTSGFQNSILTNEDAAYRNAFGIGISIGSDLLQIAKHHSSKKFNFGFATALACSCAEDEYILKNNFEAIIVLVTNVDTGEETVITSKFAVHTFDDKKVSIDEILKTRDPWLDGFSLELIDWEEIPKKAQFKTVVRLDTGAELAASTGIVNFYD